MAKTKAQIIQSIVNNFKPEPYVKNIKCGFIPHDNEKLIISIEYTIDRNKLGESPLNKKKVLEWTKELANQIRNTVKLPIGYSETKVKYI